VESSVMQPLHHDEGVACSPFSDMMILNRNMEKSHGVLPWPRLTEALGSLTKSRTRIHCDMTMCGR
jgi:hypothetical protein